MRALVHTKIWKGVSLNQAERIFAVQYPFRLVVDSAICYNSHKQEVINCRPLRKLQDPNTHRIGSHNKSRSSGSHDQRRSGVSPGRPRGAFCNSEILVRPSVVLQNSAKVCPREVDVHATIANIRVDHKRNNTQSPRRTREGPGAIRPWGFDECNPRGHVRFHGRKIVNREPRDTE